ncbi:ATPase [Colletotrichum lupini]|uniref:ATPase n=1 Tax=Colletotrichum lupini TaxID=145971 RepID=A0A9Q8WD56_9PEZI|nr:ATPase [Colletotrichum lupini]UQC79388.1 ATPase [Colletotrichum lupini]
MQATSTPTNFEGAPRITKEYTLDFMDEEEDIVGLASPDLRLDDAALLRWGWFNVEDVHLVTFNDNGFGNLVLSSHKKQLLSSLIMSQNLEGFSTDDFVEGKGKGVIILLNEVVADHARRPLLTANSGQFIGSPAEVEVSLAKLLQSATRWGALVLLDEADVFMQARNLQDLERNGIVSMLLRTLEYFEGTLFLTTNRVGTIDSAFMSRFHLTLSYEPLSESARRQLWDTWITRACRIWNGVNAMTQFQEDCSVSVTRQEAEKRWDPKVPDSKPMPSKSWLKTLCDGRRDVLSYRNWIIDLQTYGIIVPPAFVVLMMQPYCMEHSRCIVVEARIWTSQTPCRLPSLADFNFSLHEKDTRAYQNARKDVTQQRIIETHSFSAQKTAHRLRDVDLPRTEIAFSDITPQAASNNVLKKPSLSLRWAAPKVRAGLAIMISLNAPAACSPSPERLNGVCGLLSNGLPVSVYSFRWHIEMPVWGNGSCRRPG